MLQIPTELEPGDLLRPCEVAHIFGVETTTIARWARAGLFTTTRTPGGHRRFQRGEVNRVRAEQATPEFNWERKIDDAVHLYGQGWSIRQVAERFDLSYGVMRRALRSRNVLRRPGGSSRNPLPTSDL